MSEPWIRVHASIAHRPVVARLAESLRIDPFRAIGHLVTFWGAVSAHASNGAIGDVPDALIERWAGWTGKRGAFAQWVRTSHMDAEGRVNEWDEYQGRLETKRERDRQRVREYRDKQRDCTRDVTRTERVPNANGNAPVATHARERYGTVRNETDNNPPPTAREAFLSGIPSRQRTGWLATLAGWAEGMGTPGGKAFTAEQVDAGLAEYLATAQDPDYSPRHVVRYVEAAANRPANEPASPRARRPFGETGYIAGELAKLEAREVTRGVP